MPPQKFLSKSRFVIANDCPTKLFYEGKKDYANTRADDPFLKALAKGGFQVGALAKIQFGPGIEVKEQRDIPKAEKETEALLSKSPITLFEATVCYKYHSVRADILKVTGKSIDLMEVKAKGWPPSTNIVLKSGHLGKTNWLPKLYDIAYQTWVLRKRFPDFIINPYLVLPNKGTVASIDGLNQMFKLVKDGNSFKTQTKDGLSIKDIGSEILIKVDVKEYVDLILSDTDSKEPKTERQGKSFEQWVEFLAERHREDKKISPTLSENCKSCEFRALPHEYPGQKIGFDECWAEAGKPAPSARKRAFDVWYGVTGVISKKNLYFLSELNEDDIKPKGKPAPYEETNPVGGWAKHERRMLQVDHEKKPYVGPQYHPDLKTAVDIEGPLHFIDFETARTAIPFTKGRRPYEHIAFQFSHHILHRDGRVEHAAQWLDATPGKFPNFDFIRALKKALSTDSGPVFRYAKHENDVLNDIHDQLLASNESDRDELIQWIRSLATPSSKNRERFPEWRPTREFIDMLEYVRWFFWHPDMGGSNSIKVVLPSVLKSSKYLQRKFAMAVQSLNFKQRVWITTGKDGLPEDPYANLGPIFADTDISRATLDDSFGEGDDAELKDGGAAMIAYCRLQFTDLSAEQRGHIENALLRYCELDTLAMVMLWDVWCRPTEER